MTKDEARQTPLPDLLDQVPEDIVLGIPGDEPVFQSYTNIPIGKLAQQAAAELRRLHEENRRLKTVMVAAAEEIAEHWDAHCDEEGYGPVNLMRRLEEGIASEYGYTAGAFGRMQSLNNELLEALQTVMGDVNHGQHMTWEQRCRQARAAINKATGEQA